VPRFSKKSKAKLETCHEDIQTLFNAVVAGFDCTPIYGHRTAAEQQALYAIGRTTDLDRNPVTKIDGVKRMSMHNYFPSLAIDILPYPIDWKDTDRMRYFAGYVMGIADSIGVKIRWGGDWDGDTELRDQNFNDLAHFELIKD